MILDSRFDGSGVGCRRHARRSLEMAREVMDAAVAEPFGNLRIIVLFLADQDFGSLYFQPIKIFHHSVAGCHLERP